MFLKNSLGESFGMKWCAVWYDCALQQSYLISEKKTRKNNYFKNYEFLGRGLSVVAVCVEV